MRFALRPARPADLPTIANLMNSAFRGVGPNAGWNSEADLLAGDRTSEDALAADLATDPDSLLVAESDSTILGGSNILGSVHLEPLSAGAWYLGGLTIDARLQNSGLGRGLLSAAEQWARERGATTIRMTVINLRHTVIAWYERRGYHLTGEVRPFPYDDTRFGTPRRADLAFVVLEKSLNAAP